MTALLHNQAFQLPTTYFHKIQEQVFDHNLQENINTLVQQLSKYGQPIITKAYENKIVNQTVVYVQDKYHNAIELKDKVQTNAYNLVDKVLQTTENQVENQLKSIESSENLLEQSEQQLSKLQENINQLESLSNASSFIVRVQILTKKSINLVKILFSQASNQVQQQPRIKQATEFLADQYENAVVLSLLSYEFIQYNLLIPTFNYITVQYNQTKDQVFVRLEALKQLNYKEILPLINENYQKINQFAGSQLKLAQDQTILGIQMSTQQFHEQQGKVQNYLINLYKYLQQFNLSEVQQQSKQVLAQTSELSQQLLNVGAFKKSLNDQSTHLVQSSKNLYEQTILNLQLQQQTVQNNLQTLRQKIEQRKLQRKQQQLAQNTKKME